VWVARDERAAARAVGYGTAFVVAAAALGIAVGRRLGPHRPRFTPVIARIVVAGVASFMAMVTVVVVLDGTSRAAALAVLVAGGAVGALVYAGALRLLTGEPLRRLITIDDA
jgi:hypothetical protein